MAKVKVFNKNKHHVGIIPLNGIGRDIAPGSFALLDPDDIAYLMSTTTLFSSKHLTLDDNEIIETLGVSKEEISTDDDATILTKLKSSNIPALKKYLSTIKELHLRKRVAALAKESDLNTSKIKLIEETFGMTIYDA